MKTDFRMEDRGTVFMFTPLSEAAKDFVRDELEVEGWQWLGDSFGVDHRTANSLYELLSETGFSIEAI